MEVVEGKRGRRALSLLRLGRRLDHYTCNSWEGGTFGLVGRFIEEEVMIPLVVVVLSA
jgi:hypothetical protein